MAAIFDKLAYVRRLEQDGNSNRPQAEAPSEAPHDAVLYALPLPALRAKGVVP